MSERDDQHPETTEAPLSRGRLLRAGADDELSLQDAERFERLLAEDASAAAGVEFEFRLRESVGRVMSEVAVPAGLAKRVTEAVRADEAVGEALDDMAQATRSPAFWTRRSWLSAAAAAAVLALAVTVISQALGITRVPLDAEQTAYRQELAGFVMRQHERACHDRKLAEAKFLLTNPEEFDKAITERLGRDVRLPRPSSDTVRFEGGGPCGVPGKGASAHAMYKTGAGPRISVFVKQNNGELPLRPGVLYIMDPKACSQGHCRIFARVENGVTYLFVVEGAQNCQKALQALGISTPSAEF